MLRLRADLFNVSFSGIITAIIRVTKFLQLGDTLTNGDVTWVSVEAYTWNICEMAVYFIAATLPSLRPLIQFIFVESRFASYYRSILHRSSKSGQSLPVEEKPRESLTLPEWRDVEAAVGPQRPTVAPQKIYKGSRGWWDSHDEMSACGESSHSDREELV